MYLERPSEQPWPVSLFSVEFVVGKTLVTLGITITIKHNISLYGDYNLFAFYCPFKYTP